MFLSQSRLLLRKNFVNLNTPNLLTKFPMRTFAANQGAHHSTHSSETAHGDGHGHQPNHHDDHGDHDDHDHHGHHEISGEVDLNKVYVNLDSNMAKMISLVGVPHLEKVVSHSIEGQAKAKSQITPIAIPFITRNRVWHNDLANVTYDENPYFHPEPYGYLMVDDPFDPNPQTWQPYMLAAMGIFGLVLMTKWFRMNNASSDRRVLCEEIYHAHYTANLIEDEIRKIRKEDYPFRKKYHEMKTGESA
jgi:hypothetical protein